MTIHEVNVNESVNHAPQYMLTWMGGGDLKVATMGFDDMMTLDYSSDGEFAFDWERIEDEQKQLLAVLNLRPLETYVWNNLTQLISITRLSDDETALKVGDRVEFKPNTYRPIFNYDIALDGKRGTVTRLPDLASDSGDYFSIQLDEHIEDLDEWDNEVRWCPADCAGDLTFYNEFERIYTPKPEEAGDTFVTITISPEVREVLRQVLGLDQ